MKISDVVNLGESALIHVDTSDSSKIHYFILNPKGEIAVSGIIPVDNNSSEIILSKSETSDLDTGTNTIKIFASSDEVLRPDNYSTAFLVVESETSFPTLPISKIEASSEGTSYTGIVLAIIGVIIVGIIVYIRRKRKTKLSRN